MKRIPTVYARENFSDVLNHSAFGKVRHLLTRRNKDLCAVVSLEDFNRLEELDRQESKS